MPAPVSAVGADLDEVLVGVAEVDAEDGPGGAGPLDRAFLDRDVVRGEVLDHLIQRAVIIGRRWLPGGIHRALHRSRSLHATSPGEDALLRKAGWPLAEWQLRRLRKAAYLRVGPWPVRGRAGCGGCGGAQDGPVAEVIQRPGQRIEEAGQRRGMAARQEILHGAPLSSATRPSSRPAPARPPRDHARTLPRAGAGWPV